MIVKLDSISPGVNLKNHWKHHLPIQLDALRYVLWIHKPWGSLKTWRLSTTVSPLGTNTVNVEVPPGEQKHFSNGTNKNSDHESLFNPKTSAAISAYLNQTAKFRGSVHNVSSNTFFFELWAYHGVSLIVTYALETSLSMNQLGLLTQVTHLNSNLTPLAA